ncbi:MAG: class I SAM-dependent methyltransferase [Candidatus Xenobia bacterium]
MRDPTARFSDRVENYVRWRPSYPAATIDALHLPPSSVVADVGSGTGILSRLLLERGHTVYGVEPNDAMREAAERLLSGFQQFCSVRGRSEATTLPDAGADLITAAQAWHWFDREPTRREFARILKPGGRVALIWNERNLEGSGFLGAYEQLLRTGAREYNEIARAISEDDVRGFLDRLEIHHFPNQQVLDWEGLLGRCLSSSYAPQTEAFVHQLRQLYDQHQVDGTVTFTYDTRVYIGSVHGLATGRA